MRGSDITLLFFDRAHDIPVTFEELLDRLAGELTDTTPLRVPTSRLRDRATGAPNRRPGRASDPVHELLISAFSTAGPPALTATLRFHTVLGTATLDRLEHPHPLFTAWVADNGDAVLDALTARTRTSY